jgi:hypothetical protein
MIYDRLNVASGFLGPKGVIYSSIDANERRSLEGAMDKVFGAENRVEEIIWVQNTTKAPCRILMPNYNFEIEMAARWKVGHRSFGTFVAERLFLVKKLRRRVIAVSGLKSYLSLLGSLRKLEQLLGPSTLSQVIMDGASKLFATVPIAP